MSGYDVWGERMLGMRWKCLFLCTKTYLYSSTVTVVVECFFWPPHALWGDNVVRKYWVRSFLGVVGRQDDAAMFGMGMVQAWVGQFVTSITLP
jgi:hypothetical protein